MGMEMAGHECIGYVEIDKFARKSYEAIFNTEGEWTAYDITSISDESIRGIGHTDVICGGFPCQAFSIAGKRKGFEDIRGTIFFEIMRFASVLRPRYLFLENVKGLLNHENGDTFETILRTLDELGYDAEWQVLNSKDFGVPQNRERVFIIGHLRGECTRKIFPLGCPDKEINNEHKVISIGNVNPSGNGMNGQVYHSEGLSPTLTTNKGEGNKVLIKPDWVPGPNDISKTLRTGGKSSLTAKHSYDIVAVLTPDREEKRQNGRRFKEPDEPMFTLTAQDRHGVAISGIYTKATRNFQRPPLKGLSRTLKANQHDAGITDGMRIRKLTPRECWRLQGFPDWAFDKAKYYSKSESEEFLKNHPNHKGKRIFTHEERIERMSNSQLYKQAGNSVTVNVIYEIAKRL